MFSITGSPSEQVQTGLLEASALGRIIISAVELCPGNRLDLQAQSICLRKSLDTSKYATYMKHISRFCCFYETYSFHENHIPIAGASESGTQEIGRRYQRCPQEETYSYNSYG